MIFDQGDLGRLPGRFLPWWLHDLCADFCRLPALFLPWCLPDSYELIFSVAEIGDLGYLSGWYRLQGVL